MALHHDNLVDGRDAEGRIANVLRALDSDTSTAADCARWLARNWLKARRGLATVAKLTPEPDVQRAVSEALEVDDED